LCIEVDEMNTINMISALLASIILLGMAIFILIKDWRDQVNRYFVFYNLMALGILFTMFATYAFQESVDLTHLNKITQMFTIMFFASFFTMSLVFPKTGKAFPLYITLLTLTPSAIIGALVMNTDLTIARAYFRDGMLVREFKAFYSYYAAITFIYLLAGTANFIRKYFRTKVEIYRLQMRYLFVGSSFALIFAATCSIILPRLLNYSKLYAIGPSIASFIVTTALFYSVISYNLLEIRTAIHKTAMYSIISTIIFIPIYAIIAFYYNGSFYLDRLPLHIIVALVVVVFFILSFYVHPQIDRMFKRKQYQFENIVDTFIRKIEEIKDPNSVIERTIDTLFKSLYLRRAFYLAYNEKTRKYEVSHYKGGDSDGAVEPVDRNSTLIRWFVRNQEVLNVGRIYTDDKSFADIRDEMIDFFIANDLVTIMPIYHEKRVIGLVCLGAKDTLAAYTPDELEKLATFQKESNEIISTTLTYQKASEEQFIARTLDLSSYILAKSIPGELPNVQGIKFGAFMIPRYAEGVDYFDFIRPAEDGIGVIITDVSGVGINSALYSILLRSAFQSCLNDAPSTYSVTQTLNRVVYEYSKGKGGLVTSYYMYYDIKSMRLMYTNAGFPSLDLFRVEKNDFDSLDTEGIPLGYDISASYGSGRTNMLRGDIGILYTRSLVNAKNQKGEKFGLLRLREVIKENRSRKPTEIARGIHKAYEKFMGLSSPEADIMTLVFKIG